MAPTGGRELHERRCKIFDRPRSPADRTMPGPALSTPRRLPLVFTRPRKTGDEGQETVDHHLYAVAPGDLDV